MLAKQHVLKLCNTIGNHRLLHPVCIIIFIHSSVIRGKILPRCTVLTLKSLGQFPATVAKDICNEVAHVCTTQTADSIHF